MDYDKLLKRARKDMPESLLKKKRFDIPKAIGIIQGNKTIIKNFIQICSIFGREPRHLLKYLQRELASPAQIDGPRLVFGRKFRSELINQKIKQYAKEFVLCKECGKPDTKLLKEEGFTFIKCTACGAKHSIKARI